MDIAQDEFCPMLASSGFQLVQEPLQDRIYMSDIYDDMLTIKLLTLYSVKDQESIAFANQPGNIPDAISIDNALKELAFLDFDHPMIVTDNGCCSERNLMKFTRKNMKFLTLVDPNVNNPLIHGTGRLSRFLPFPK